MNEFFAAEPSACRTPGELTLLLGYFGPFAGRYLAAYPKDWFQLTEAAFSQLGDLDRERVKTLWRRAREGSAILSRPNLSWEHGKSWIENAVTHAIAKPPVFHGLVARESSPGGTVPIFAVEELELSPTAEERVDGTPEEYARVCRTLLVISPEIHLVDPFLDVTKRDVCEVLKALLGVAAIGRCRGIKMWVRYSQVVGTKEVTTALGDIESRLRELAAVARLASGVQMTYDLLRDEDRRCKMHGRYLLSVKGGIRLDQGFQCLPNHRKVDVGPIGKRAYEEIASTYLDGKNDFSLVRTVSIFA